MAETAELAEAADDQTMSREADRGHPPPAPTLLLIARDQRIDKSPPNTLSTCTMADDVSVFM